MKKILPAAMLLAVVALSSCNQMESKAKRQLRSTMEELAKNPETFKMSNEKVVFLSDSMCTISFIGRGQNGLGGYSSTRMEYTLVKVNRKDGDTQYNESLINMEEKDERKSSIKETLEKIDGGYLRGAEKDAYDETARECKTKEEAKANYLYFKAMCNTIIHGRIVE